MCLFLQLSGPIRVGNKHIEYSISDDHVGVVFSYEGGNMPHIIRISAHKQAISMFLHSGAAYKFEVEEILS